MERMFVSVSPKIPSDVLCFARHFQTNGLSSAISILSGRVPSTSEWRQVPGTDLPQGNSLQESLRVPVFHPEVPDLPFWGWETLADLALLGLPPPSPWEEKRNCYSGSEPLP